MVEATGPASRCQNMNPGWVAPVCDLPASLSLEVDTQKANPCVKGRQDGKILAVPRQVAARGCTWRSLRASVGFDAPNLTSASRGQARESDFCWENWPSPPDRGARIPAHNPDAAAVPRTPSCFSLLGLGGVASRVLLIYSSRALYLSCAHCLPSPPSPV